MASGDVEGQRQLGWCTDLFDERGQRIAQVSDCLFWSGAIAYRTDTRP